MFLKWLKMVLSPLQVREGPVTAKKTRTDAKPKTAPEPQKRNKNHFTPISEQACALPYARICIGVNIEDPLRCARINGVCLRAMV